MRIFCLLVEAELEVTVRVAVVGPVECSKLPTLIYRQVLLM
jgi:hypothetical protein